MSIVPEIRGIDTEMREPKYAHIEYERRWLVDRTARPPVGEADGTLIEDRYIDGTRMRLRRMSRAQPDVTKWKLTKKYACREACARPIVTSYLTEQEYELLNQLPALPLTKRRYHVPFEGRWWSLDVFEGALEGLELIECETDDRASLAALVPPPWAGREITDMDQWQGGALAATQQIPED